MATIISSTPLVTTNPARHPRSIMRRIESVWGFVFIMPWIIGFLLFTGFPMVASLYLSFTDYKITDNQPANWIGLTNYRQMLSLEFKTLSSTDQKSESVLTAGYSELLRVNTLVIGASDPLFWKSIKVTLLYAVLSLPLSLFAALGLALLMNLKLPGIMFYRTIIYLPSVIPAVASAIVLQQILNRDIGWLNLLLSKFGITGPDWINDERYIMPALVLITLWGVGQAMVIYLAGLQGVPSELYEAAKVDGANGFVRLRRITLPLISPVILYNLVIGLIGTFQYFTTAYVLTQGLGTPNYSTYFYNMYLFKRAFAFTDMGYASAMAWVLVVIVTIITAVVFTTSGNWVFYAGSRKSS